MTATAANPPPAPATAKYANAAEWWHALGGVPLERIVFDPWPGTATEQDLLVFVERDKRLVELIDGTLVEKPVGFDESQIGILLSYFLMNWVHPRQLGVVVGADATLRMSSGRVRLPDVAFVSTERLAALPIPHPAIPSIAPDLAVEVLSESNTRAEIRQKLKEYFESGTHLAWVIDPTRRTIAIYEGPTEQPARILNDHDMLDGGAVLPGFTLAIADLFAKLPKSST